jgi:hypothetical protein
MKKSEMAEKLENLLSKIAYAEDKNELVYEDEIKVKMILNLLETEGMLPPGHKSKFWSREDNDFYTVNEWELEDENS